MYPSKLGEINDEIISLGGSSIPIELNNFSEPDQTLLTQLDESYNKIKEFYEGRL